MSDLTIDTDLAIGHADAHDTTAQNLHTALNGVPTEADGGVAAQEIALMVALAVGEAGALADVNSIVGGVVRDIATSVSRTDESAQEAFQPLVQGLMEP